MLLVEVAQRIVIILVAVAGLIRCVALTRALLDFCWRHFLRPAKPLQSYGRWAVVTGATDGIGREYCNALAQQGLNIYLISRTESKLASAADEIKSAYSVETKYFVADLTASGESADTGACWYGLKSNLEGLDVGVLINNAGMSFDHPDFLHSVDLATVGSIVAINASSLTKMTQVILTGMKERGKGCIVNISSGVSSALPACPLLSVYAASKAYVDSLSQALHAEGAQFGIRVQAQSPAFVATKMAKMRRTSLFVPSAKTWVTAAVKHIGYESAAVPYWPHALLSVSLKMLPDSFVVPYWFNMTSKMRARALKKKTAGAKAS